MNVNIKMSNEISPERKEFLMEQAARYIVDNDLEDIAIVVLEGTAPFGDVVGELGIMMSYPLAVTFFNRLGSDFVKMFGFNYQENAKDLMDRIKKLQEQKKIQKQKQKELENNVKKKKE